MRTSWLVLASALLVVAIAGHGCAEAANTQVTTYESHDIQYPSPTCTICDCRDYAGRICEPGDSNCVPAPSECVLPCFKQGDCLPGHGCVNLFKEASGTWCDSGCRAEYCPAGQECQGLECQEVECGVKVKCAEKAQICDVFAQACYPVNGNCDKADDCPGFNRSAQELGQVACDAGFCRMAAKAPGVPKGVTNIPKVELLRPKFGDEVAQADALTLEWLPQEKTSIVLVMKRLPMHFGELLQAAIWGRMLAAGATAKSTFAEGHAIVDGKWQKASPTIPVGQPLYAVVQTVGGGQLTGVSAVVPFIVGGKWPAAGSVCPVAADGDIMGPCANPVHLQQCIDGTCKRVCLSNADCAGIGQGFNCGPVVKGLRQCL